MADRNETVVIDRVIQAGFLILPLMFFLIPPGFTSGILRASAGHIAAFLILSFVVIGAQARNLWARAFSWYLALYILFLEYVILFKPFGIVVYRQGWITMLEHSVYIFLGFAIYNAISRTRSCIDNWFDIICLGAVFQALHGLPQVFGFWPYINLLNAIGIHTTNPIPAIVGTLVNINFFSAYLAISIVFFFRMRKYRITIAPHSRIPGLKTGKDFQFRINWHYFLILIIPLLLLSKTSTAVASAVVGIFFYYGLNWRIIIPTIAMSAFFFWTDWASVIHSDRFNFWVECLRNYKLTTMHLLLGHGPGISWGKQWHLHNDWLQIFYQFGMTGIYIILGYLLSIYRGNKRLFAALAAVCVNMVGNFPAHLAPTMLLIIIILGLIERARHVEHHITQEGLGYDLFITLGKYLAGPAGK